MLFDYAVLKLIWWVAIGLLLIGFALTDGYDLGVAGLISLLGKTDTEKRMMINTVAPHWDGHQVWLISAAGAMFAAWPVMYAAAFSGFYWAMLLVLFALMGRPLAFEYRSKVEPEHRRYCDLALFVSYLVPGLVFGVAFGNLFEGIGFSVDASMRIRFSEGFWHLLNPFALLCGLVSLSMLLAHGAAWIKLRTAGSLARRAGYWARISALVCLVLFIGGGFWVAHLPGFYIKSMQDPSLISNVLDKVVIRDGSWLDNYQHFPWMHAAPLLGCVGMIGCALFSTTRYAKLTFTATAFAIIGVIATAGLSLFPFIFPSSTHFNASLTMWDATSSPLTLSIMTVGAGIFLPILTGYTFWCMRKMWVKIDADYIEKNTHKLY